MRSALYLFAAACMAAAQPGNNSAAPLPVPAEPDVPAGVVKVTVPAGTVTWNWIGPKERASGRPTLRFTVGQTVVQADRIFIGDGKMATLYEATEEGIHWASPTGRKGFIFHHTMVWENGSGSIDVGNNYWTPDQLKPGSVYVVTRSIKFDYEVRAKAASKP
jgi:hypothetical protein